MSIIKILKEGFGIPLVFLHGFLGVGEDWEEVVSFLPPCKCIAVDLPGHGDAPFSKTFDLEIDSPKFYLIGYSMGGRLAMQYASLHPERIEQLVIVSAHPGLTSEKEKENRRKTDAEWAKRLKDLPIDDFLELWYAQPIFANFKPDLTRRRNQNKEALADALLHYSLANQPLFSIKNALYIVGEKDLKFRALHPEATVIEGAGHMVHVEKPKDFAKILEKNLLK